MKSRIPISIISLLLSTSTAAMLERYEDWLNKEVAWIIGSGEKERLKSLETGEEVEAFIDDFWKLRDPTPGTDKNEYKEEHYRRWKYADEQFVEGNVPGWRTDRGRIYIIHGPPASRSIQSEAEIWAYNSNPNARYYRGFLALQFERGGSTFQQRALSESSEAQRRLERYQMGPRDPQTLFAQTNRYRLVAAGPRFGPGGTILTSAGETDRYIGDLLRSPGDVLEEKLKDEERRRQAWKDLQTDVSSAVAFGELDLGLESATFFAGGDRRIFLEIEFESDQIKFEKSELGGDEASVDLFCEILSVADNYQVDFLETTLRFARSKKGNQLGILSYSDRFRVSPGNYRLKCLIQDVRTKKVGVKSLELQQALEGAEKLALSSILLTQDVQQVSESDFTSQEYPLEFQALRFPVRISRGIDRTRPLYLYFELDNHRKSDGTRRNLYFDYKLYDDQTVYLKLPLKPLEIAGNGSFALQFDVSKLPIGEYSFLLKVVDADSKEFAMKVASFKLEPGS